MMNRRDFMGKLGLGLMVLPAAKTYARRWASGLLVPEWQVNPDWLDAPFEADILICSDDFKEVLRGFGQERETHQGWECVDG